MTKSLKNWWGRFLFRDRGILPTKRLLLLFGLLSVGLLILSFTNLSWVWMVAINIVLFVISFIDLFLSPKKNELTWERKITNELERGIRYEVQLKVTNHSRSSCSVEILDGLPESFQTALPVHGTVEKQASKRFVYEIIPHVRGKYRVNQLYIRYRSFIGLWQKQWTIYLSDEVKVIPDLTKTKQYLQSAQQFLLYEGEKIRKQQTGAGEFARIRSYVVGDDPRKINWRQTAKLQEVMTNEYEPEHGKYMTILIDCGRMMGVELKDGNRLEKSIEAALTVTAAALKNGDYVSVLAFSKDVKVFVPPAKGMDQLQKILQAIYNLQVDATESNYPAVLQYLQSVQKKRSLLLLFSDIQSFLYDESMLSYLGRLRQRHLMLMVGIKDEALQQAVEQDIHSTRNAMEKSIAQQQVQKIKRHKAKWENQGLLMVEAKEEQLATAAVSYYIELLNDGLL